MSRFFFFFVSTRKERRGEGEQEKEGGMKKERKKRKKRQERKEGEEGGREERKEREKERKGRDENKGRRGRSRKERAGEEEYGSDSPPLQPKLGGTPTKNTKNWKKNNPWISEFRTSRSNSRPRSSFEPRWSQKSTLYKFWMARGGKIAVCWKK
jgi:hypothetical protein